MVSIYNCKMFRCSPRKDFIISAMQNPVNHELVQQLRDYIDVDQPDEMVKDNNNANRNPETSQQVDTANEQLPAGFERGSFLARTPGLVVDEIEDVPDPSDDMDANYDQGATNDSSQAEETEEADDIEAKPEHEEVQESTKVVADTLIPEHIKGTLNIDDATAGVSRAVIKDKELWLYYNDSINLNNVMTEVLDKVNSANFSTLSFSRLARSDNAIVFDILQSSQLVEVISNGDAQEA